MVRSYTGVYRCARIGVATNRDDMVTSIVMANIIENRLELSFADAESRLAWANQHTCFRGDVLLLIYKEAWSEEECYSRVLDDEETEDGAIVIFFDSRWSAPCSWFADMVRANLNIAQACLSHSDPNVLSVGEMEWDGTDLTETYREGNELTPDDFFILGVDRCQDCSEFLCTCDEADGAFFNV